MNVGQLAQDALKRLGERSNLDFEGTRYTNAQILDLSRRLQRGLTRLGIKERDLLTLCMINHPFIFPIFQGTFRSGATAIPVMYQLGTPELRYILEDTRSRGIFTDQFSLAKVEEAVEGLDHIEWIVVREGVADPNASPPRHTLESLLEEDPAEEMSEMEPDDVALMLYTSGTTGRPKGVMLTHANLLAAAQAAAEASELDRWQGPRVGISSMPMAHIYGVGVMNVGYLTPKHLADSYGVQMAWFEPERFMQLVEEHRCTTMASVPTMLSLILNHPKADQYDLSSLKEVICGAAPLATELADAFAQRYGCRVREIYGLTENTGLGTATRLGDPRRPGSAGRAYINMELAIFDDDDQPVATGERGEVVMRGPTVMKGYLNRPEDTAEAMRGGWLHTGDVGYLDEEGFLYIVDRKKDMILRGGENIYPAEIEDILYTHAQVAEAAVVGTPDPVYGENVVAFVVPRSGTEPTEKEIIDFVKQQTAPFKAPQTVHFLVDLPKSGVGKILRRKLREQAGEKSDG